jgi:protoporphyrinogen oxidase
MCLVALMVAEEPFSECWIHVRDRSVRATRVLNFGALSRDMVAPGTTCLGVEYFCDVGDRIWTMSEAEAIELAKRELAGLGLLDDRRVFDGARIRVPRAYPIRGRAGEDALAVVRDHLQEIENLQTFGRDGLHCASTQDHSMWTALLAATNLLHGTSHDVWAVAQDLAPGDAEPHPPASYIPPLGEAVGDLAG